MHFVPIVDYYYQQYRELAEQEPYVIFGRRLATYRYMDMDEVMESAMMVSKG